MLAEGGYSVGKLATLLFLGGIDVNTNTSYSSDVFENKAKWMQQYNVILYEPAFKNENGKNARVEIIEKKGNNINPIEVKSKSWNSYTYIFERKPKESDKENVSNNFQPYW